MSLDLIPNAKAAIIAQLQPIADLVAVRNRGQSSPLAYTLILASPTEQFRRPKDPSKEIVDQKREIIFQGLMKIKDLRSEDQALRVWEGIVELLTGFRPSPCHQDRLFPLSRRLLEADENGFWALEFQFGWLIDNNEDYGLWP